MQVSLHVPMVIVLVNGLYAIHSSIVWMAVMRQVIFVLCTLVSRLSSDVQMAAVFRIRKDAIVLIRAVITVMKQAVFIHNVVKMNFNAEILNVYQLSKDVMVSLIVRMVIVRMKLVVHRLHVIAQVCMM